MVCELGMESFGPVAVPELPRAGETGAPVAPEAASLVRALLDREADRALALLRAHRSHLEALAAALLRTNCLTRADLQEMLPSSRPAALREVE